jgi:hypothetical protein
LPLELRAAIDVPFLNKGAWWLEPSSALVAPRRLDHFTAVARHVQQLVNRIGNMHNRQRNEQSDIRHLRGGFNQLCDKRNLQSHPASTAEYPADNQFRANSPEPGDNLEYPPMLPQCDGQSDGKHERQL